MAKAIVTKFHPATGHRGSRVSATAEGGKRPHRVSIGTGMCQGDPHVEAARALAIKLGWRGRWVGGGLPNGKGDAYVCVDWSGELTFDSTGRW